MCSAIEPINDTRSSAWHDKRPAALLPPAQRNADTQILVGSEQPTNFYVVADTIEMVQWTLSNRLHELQDHSGGTFTALRRQSKVHFRMRQSPLLRWHGIRESRKVTLTG